MSPRTTSVPRPHLAQARPERSRWFEVPAEKASIGAVRRAVGKQLTAWHLAEEVRADAALLLSELATNAVVHTPSTRILCGVEVVADQCLLLEVHDHHRTSDGVSRCYPGPDDERGRGLLLVESIAWAWGVDHSRLTHGNAVWAILRTDF